VGAPHVIGEDLEVGLGVHPSAEPLSVPCLFGFLVLITLALKRALDRSELLVSARLVVPQDRQRRIPKAAQPREFIFQVSQRGIHHVSPPRAPWGLHPSIGATTDRIKVHYAGEWQAHVGLALDLRAGRR
jgi:hypothetical protein